MPPLIILFARAPVPGRVKTRLGLPPERAAALHSAFVRDTLEMLLGLGAVELSTDTVTTAWSEYPAARSVQAPGDLGAKLQAAIEGGLARGHNGVLVLGSDSPTLPPEHVRALLDSTEDVALGPTEDGGYYGICCRRARAGMFASVEWSSAETLETTVDALTRAGLAVEIGPRWYDIDEPRDLERLRRDPGLRVYARAALG
jgi:uncharacterized protein